ncbi:MAG TPA: ATP-binding cassette domain-containing protein [Cyclobacteriaceae bacterium]|nr:ATP-binding cassette domain-containing protein [Cyclobacteriaceae bacterium]
MSEELLKAIVQLFAIVAKERITEDERNNIKDFLSLHLNQEAINYYLGLFDDYSRKISIAERASAQDIDSETIAFVDDWSNIMQISKKVNQSLTAQQKLVLLIKIINLVNADGSISDHQENLIFYIAEALKIEQKDVNAMRSFVVGQDADELSSRHILIIDEGSGNEALKGHRIVAKNLTGLIAILKVPSIDVYFIKYLGISTLYLNSIPMRSRKIDVFPTGSTIRGNKIEPIYYSDVVSKFLVSQQETQITFSAEHLFYHFKSGRVGLQNVNISEQGGKLIGIMGGSGSGKSTLLNVLNGTEKPSSGRVIINNINIHEQPELIEGVIGYIPQDDLLIEELTVYENLYYAARLCFGHYSLSKIVALVERVISLLGLTEIRNLKVGSVLEKTISGGQRKRLNIGLELLREPTVLFVDEPTSGLSSRDSENIMDLLKELSLRGKMIFVVIHQPSSDIFKMFDSLIILDAGGFQIYYGNPLEAVMYFRDIVNATNKNQGACPECGNVNPEQIFDIIETRIVNEYGRLTDVRKISPGQWYQYFHDKIKVPKLIHTRVQLPVTQKIPKWLQQLRLFLTRDMLAKFANKQYLLINIFQAPLLAAFIAYLVRYYATLGIENPSYSFHENENMPIFYFMSVVVALFFGLTMSAEEIFRDRRILKREKFLNLSKSGYLMAKVGVMFLFSAFQTFTFLVIGNLILEVPITELRFWFILFASSCFANMLGLNISSSFNSAVTIYILIPILLIPQLMLSGVVINFDKFNPRLGSMEKVPLIGEVMASRWAFEAYMVSQFKDNPFEQQFYEIDKVLYNAEYKKLYYIPVLESKLAYCFNHPNAWRSTSDKIFINSIELLRNEIGKELGILGPEHFTQLSELQVGRFNMQTYEATRDFLSNLKYYYSRKFQEAFDQKEQLISSLTATPEDRARYDAMRMRYQNDAVIQAVKNTSSATRIVEINNQLYQKIYPVYMDNTMIKHRLDFRASFYESTKQFMGQRVDTFYFNIGVIWLMTFVLYITLYYDTLPKAMKLFRRRPATRRK